MTEPLDTAAIKAEHAGHIATEGRGQIERYGLCDYPSVSRPRASGNHCLPYRLADLVGVQQSEARALAAEVDRLRAAEQRLIEDVRSMPSEWDKHAIADELQRDRLRALDGGS